MRKPIAHPSRSTAARIGGVLLLIGLVLALDALASSPVLHQRICVNASKPDHRCAATDFASGLADVPVVAVLSAPVTMIWWIPIGSTDRVGSAAPLLRLSPARPPPVEPFSGW